ncbi:putative odorant receptor 92a [Odontomachus brunneus]|uniref:putative odorant receptor 92a n=1 Tax=Odontomachus brunneus TaxID=486640 RepID=UPI0013F26B43|nr:putative odorant receptor 92a [Odontomachus brunneus]
MHQPVGQRKLVFHVDYYISQKSPNYEITYFIQVFGAISTGFISATIGTFIPMLLLHISAQLINLRMMLNILVKKLVGKSISFSTFKKDLGTIIVRHINLIRMTETINNCYNAVSLIYMIATTIQMCFQSFELFMIISGENKNISITQMGFRACYVVGLLVRLYFYCYSSEQLMAESTNVAYGVYECQWYDLPSKNAQDLMFIVHRSRIPLKMTAGKFATFSMEMFGTKIIDNNAKISNIKLAFLLYHVLLVVLCLVDAFVHLLFHSVKLMAAVGLLAELNDEFFRIYKNTEEFLQRPGRKIVEDFRSKLTLIVKKHEHLH